MNVLAGSTGFLNGEIEECSEFAIVVTSPTYFFCHDVTNVLLVRAPKLAQNTKRMEKMASVVSEVNTAVQGVRQLLKEERKGGTSATAARHCQVYTCICSCIHHVMSLCIIQALYHSVQQLLQTVERYRNTRDDDDSGTGSIEIISDLLCVCFQTSSQVLSLCKVSICHCVCMC